MASSFKKIAFALGYILLTFIILFIAFIIYASYSEHVAKAKATEFCQPIIIGNKSIDLINQAISFGADKRQTKWFKDSDGVDQLPVTFTGATSLSRHICWVTAEDDLILSKKVIYLD